MTADNYVFCGTCAHHNPEIEVIEAFAKVRSVGIDGSDPVQPGKDFKFWFTSNAATSGLSDARVTHMTGVADKVADLKGEDDHLEFEFIPKGKLPILE